MLLAASLNLDNETVIQTFHFEAEASPFTTSKGHYLANYFRCYLLTNSSRIPGWKSYSFSDILISTC